MKKALTYTLAVLAIVAVCVVLFSLLGAVVYLLPPLGGAFAKKNNIENKIWKRQL